MSIEVIYSKNLPFLKTLPDNSVDSIVTDPPYEQGFMGKKWDKTGIAYSVDLWAECLRILKPGGYLLSFGGSRTYHRMACAIEDAGFEIRDQIQWIYGSGFPKSLDISKAIDHNLGFIRDKEEKSVGDISNSRYVGKSKSPRVIKNIENKDPINIEAKKWQEWGTALKPAHEPICMARKPLSEKTVAANVLKWGVGGINIDGCRVETEEGGRPLREVHALRDNVQYTPSSLQGRVDGSLQSSKAIGSTTQGRFPANVILDEEAGKLLDEQSGPAGAFAPVKRGQKGKSKGIYGDFAQKGDDGASFYGDRLGASRFFYCAKASRKERNKGLEGFEIKPLNWSSGTKNPGSFQSEGTNKSSQNNHPTVKPIALIRYLCRLVTPPGGTIVDPFNGSGTTGIVCALEGFNYKGIDDVPEYCEMSEARIEAWRPNKTTKITEDQQYNLF